ncbi:sensor histidine kinase [Oscillatoria salina]|uniref:sensor histidine kinase n=1 Tax=Oscillatoria salina TaxID=331517 RepID=UPI001CCBD6D6|nr:ATP-binding protein [Oscillatoria salina]MBZ8179385.1 ATPase [Oscillatoria salina IIICB1]
MINSFLVNYFIPHGHCYLWKTGLVGLHTSSDALISLAYFLIPLELIYIVKKRQDIPFDWVFMLFSSFIICCGITHVMEIWTLWHPNYWLSGYLKAVTAVVSLCTAWVVVELIPKVLAIPSPEQLKRANLALENEIKERKQIQEKLSQLTSELEERVQQRTAELERANKLLQQENKERSLAEEALRQSEYRLQQKAEELAITLQELQQAEAQLVQSEKMTSLGQMVAGIAHEINNPINFIYANIPPINEYTKNFLELIELYQKHYPQPVAEIAEKIEEIELDFIAKDVGKIVNSIKIGSERIRGIIKSLRTFSRLDESEKKEIEIHEGIDSTLMLLQHRIKENSHCSAIEIIKNYGELPLVECYASKINQVLMNIFSNAIDALEEKQRKMKANTEYNSLEANFSPRIEISTNVVENTWVQIEITDNGIGISPDVCQKIYDPFYTTKPVGYGTGLGLAISYQIINNEHRGILTCVSELEKETKFIIKIPLNTSKKKVNNFCS